MAQVGKAAFHCASIKKEGEAMKNWIIYSVAIVASLVIVITVGVLWITASPFLDVQKKAEQLVIDTERLVEVEESYVYNGKSPYVTVFGKDEDGEDKALFVPVNMKEEFIQTVKLADGVTAEQALSALNDEAEVKEVLHAKLGFEEVGAVWEITYLNAQNTLNYEYILFEDGQWWKRILNL